MYLSLRLDKMIICVRGTPERRIMHKKIIVAIAVTVCVAVAGIVYVMSRRDTKATVFEEITTLFEEETQEIVSKEEALIYVYVCGQVNNPGVVVLNNGSRVYEAIELAGGLTSEANSSGINQAELLRDGGMIYVPMVGENYTVPIGNNSDDKTVNINTASVEELTTLPGIGESRAKDIIAYRDSNGLFATIEDIMNVSGIKESAFNRIKDYIIV